MTYDFDGYVGLEWEENGRGPRYDCWGLIRLPYQDHLGLELPSYSSLYTTYADKEVLRGLFEKGREQDWHEVPEGQEQTHDLILLRDSPWHVGIVVRPGLMLHMPQKRYSLMESYQSMLQRRRVEGRYRHRTLLA